jgi:CelD/BcsL family acetyltransferase involved in cellulose biosynthesis
VPNSGVNLRRQLEPDVRECDERGRDVLQRIIKWKRAQCKNTGTFYFFSEPWTIDLIQEIHRFRKDCFRGLLSGLFIGDRLIAAHFGMCSKSICH